MPASLVVNNLFIGSGTTLSGTLSADHNLSAGASALVNLGGYDYHLAPGSPAINAGRDPGSDLFPQWEYVHSCGRTARISQGTANIGAYEFQS
jgi:hypothetical protein